jgi:site-specific recombinase XerD
LPSNTGLILDRASGLATHCNLLLPFRGGHHGAYSALSKALKQAAQQAGCSQRITPHRLRHTYATEMLRAGASLPEVMDLLGHNTVTMTLRYVQVTQNDLQRE